MACRSWSNRCGSSMVAPSLTFKIVVMLVGIAPTHEVGDASEEVLDVGPECGCCRLGTITLTRRLSDHAAILRPSNHVALRLSIRPRQLETTLSPLTHPLMAHLREACLGHDVLIAPLQKER